MSTLVFLSLIINSYDTVLSHGINHASVSSASAKTTRWITIKKVFEKFLGLNNNDNNDINIINLQKKKIKLSI